MFDHPRMSILAKDSSIAAHEIVESGGIVRFKTGEVTAWKRDGKRLTCPQWEQWDSFDWSAMEWDE